jgi:glycosyltransferase involved in cell wall biosynthesis
MFERAKQSVPWATTPRLPVVPLAIPESATRTQDRAESLRRLELSSDALRFLYFGRLCHKTKADLLPLLRAFREVHDQHPRTQLLIAGAAWESESLHRYERYADELEIRRATSFCVNVSPETRECLFASADVLVAPADSLQESFGLVLLEAMAAGLPIVASDYNGYRDVIGDSGAGLLVKTLAPALPAVSAELPFEDRLAAYETFSQSTALDIPQLTDAMLELARSPERRSDLAARGKRHVSDNFRWPTVARRHYAVWNELCSIAALDNTPAVQSPYVYDHGAVFRHHVTEVLRQDSVVALSRLAVHSRLPLSEPPCHLKESTLEAILERLQDGPVEAASLAMPLEVALQHLAYLVKHGMARVLD